MGHRRSPTAGCRFAQLSVFVTITVAVIACKPLQEPTDDVIIDALAKPDPTVVAHSLCSEFALPLDISFDKKPYARVSLGGKIVRLTVDTGAASESIIRKDIFDYPVNSEVVLHGFSFPTFSGGKFTVMDTGVVDLNEDANGDKYTDDGVIGYNFLHFRNLEFHYDNPPYLGISAKPCSAAKLISAGFVPIDQHGFYPSSQTPYDAVPIVYGKLDSVVFPVRIDTGFGEIPASGDLLVNRAFTNMLRNRRLELTRVDSTNNTNCRGVTISAVRWRTTDPHLFTIVSDINGDHTLFEYSSITMVEKDPSDTCAFYTHSSIPTAWLGAVYLDRWKTLIIDPYSERVWLKPNLMTTLSSR